MTGQECKVRAHLGALAHLIEIVDVNILIARHMQSRHVVQPRGHRVAVMSQLLIVQEHDLAS
jgi:hypothetical protein